MKSLLFFCTPLLGVLAACSGNGGRDASTEVDAAEDTELDLDEEEEGDRTTHCSDWQVPDETLTYGALTEYTGPSSQTTSLRVAVLSDDYWVLAQSTSTREKRLFNITTDGMREVPVTYEDPTGDHCSGLVNDILATEAHFILLYDTCASLLSTEGVESNWVDISGGSEGWTRGHGCHFVDSEIDISVISKVAPDIDTEGFLTFRLDTDATRLNEGEYIETHSTDAPGWRLDQYPINTAIKTSDRLFAGFYGSNSSTPESDHDVVYFAMNPDGTLYSELIKVPSSEYYQNATLRFAVRAGNGTVMGWTSFMGPETPPLHHLNYIEENVRTASDLSEDVTVMTSSDTMEGISTHDKNSFILLTKSQLPSIDHCIDFYLTTGWNPTDIESGPATTHEVGGGIGFMDSVHTARMATKSDSILIVWNDYWNFDESADFYTAINYLILPSD
jgi:hypothetical protein